MPLSDQSRVVVIGGTSGIGLAVARAASAAGAVVAVASRTQSAVSSALAQLPERCMGHIVDASSSSDIERFFDDVGAFDHLVYTAARPLRPVPLADYSPELAREFFDLRIVMALEAVRLAVPHLSNHGSITLTSGTAAFKGGAGWLLGSAASGATISATRSLAAELAPIRVNAVVPGVVRSPLWSDLPELEREAMYELTASSLPLGRIAEVDDVAKAYVQLMDQDYATGVISVVDGGALVS